MHTNEKYHCVMGFDCVGDNDEHWNKILEIFNVLIILKKRKFKEKFISF